MLTHPELVSLAHLLVDERVLSVYLNGDATDPATSRSWRVQLDHSLKDLRRWLEGSSHAERAEFERAVERLNGELARFERAVGAPGWAAFITPERVHLAEPLPVSMPTLAVWSTGICLAPYLRALKQTRPVVIVLADARAAHLYTYRAGALTQAGAVRAHAVTEPPAHMGDAPRQGFHPGTRGSTGRDAAQPSLNAANVRMHEEAAQRATELAGADGWLLAAGVPHQRVRIARTLEVLAPGRVLEVDTLDIHATPAQIAATAQEGASRLRDAADARVVSQIIVQAETDGHAALGPTATRDALDQARVRALYLTPHYLEEHLAEAEDAVRAAIAQGAEIEEVSRAVAATLDEHGGMGARLRYVMNTDGSNVTALTSMPTAADGVAARDHSQPRSSRSAPLLKT